MPKHKNLSSPPTGPKNKKLVRVEVAVFVTAPKSMDLDDVLIAVRRGVVIGLGNGSKGSKVAAVDFGGYTVDLLATYGADGQRTYSRREG